MSEHIEHTSSPPQTQIEDLLVGTGTVWNDLPHSWVCWLIRHSNREVSTVQLGKGDPDVIVDEVERCRGSIVAWYMQKLTIRNGSGGYTVLEAPRYEITVPKQR